MAVPKDKVIAAINKKVNGSLTKDFKQAIAAKMADKIENEDGIDAYIDDHMDFFTETQAEADRRVTIAKATPAEKPKDEPAQAAQDANTPEYLKPLLSKLESLSTQIEGMKAEKNAQSLSERFSKDERLKEVNPVFLKGRVPATEEQYETAVSEAATDWTAIATTTNLQNFGKDKPGSNATQRQVSGETKEATREELDAVMSKMNI